MMKKLILLLFLSGIFCFSLSAQFNFIFNEMSNPDPENRDLMRVLMFGDQAIASSGSGSLYLNGKDWTLFQTEADISLCFSGIEKANGEIYAVALGRNKIFLWNDSIKEFSLVGYLPPAPNKLLGGEPFVLKEKEVYFFLSDSKGFSSLWFFDEENCQKKLDLDGNRYFGKVFAKSGADILLTIYNGDFKNWQLTRFDGQDFIPLFAFDDYTVGEIFGLSTKDSINFYMVTCIGNVYRWSEETKKMDTIYLAPETDQWKFSWSISLIDNYNIIVSGKGGVKYLKVSPNRGTITAEVIYSFLNPIFYLNSSAFSGNRGIFVGSSGIIREMVVSSSVLEEEKTDWNIYPNPVADWLTIESEHFILTPKKVEIFNISGQLVLTQDFFLKANVDLSGLSRGTYLVILREEEGGLLEKRVIIKK